jgi:hypothetical protein
MCPPIPAARHSAGVFSNRIEVIPSLVAASAWFAWLALACTVTWLAVALPWFLRFSICATVAAAGLRGMRAFVLLRGPHAVRAIEWTDAGEWSVCLGAKLERHAATLANGSFRLGDRYWVLRFKTTAGACSVLVEEKASTSRAFRRLSRCLHGHVRRGSGRSRQPAVTIRPKV